MFSFSMTNDSAYVFPITNYASNLLETKIAGEKGMISETRQQGNLKFLYRLRIDETALKRRNVNPKPTEYRKRILGQDVTRASAGQAIQLKTPGNRDTTGKNDAFRTGFEKNHRPLRIRQSPGPSLRKTVPWPPNALPVSLKQVEKNLPAKSPSLRKAKLFDYKLKFSVDNFSGGFNNDVLISRYQIYTGSLPVSMQNGSSFNGMIKASIFDLFEDIRFTGAFRVTAYWWYRFRWWRFHRYGRRWPLRSREPVTLRWRQRMVRPHRLPETQAGLFIDLLPQNRAGQCSLCERQLPEC